MYFLRGLTLPDDSGYIAEKFFRDVVPGPRVRACGNGVLPFTSFTVKPSPRNSRSIPANSAPVAAALSTQVTFFGRSKARRQAALRIVGEKRGLHQRMTAPTARAADDPYPQCRGRCFRR